jgi:hypothetical protein
MFRWDTTTERDLNPLVLGVDAAFDPTGPRHMAYSPAHHRLYLGYDSGAISYLELGGTLAQEQLLRHLPLAVESVATAGELVVAQDANESLTSPGFMRYIIDAAGAVRHQGDRVDLARAHTHDPITDRIYSLVGSVPGSNLIWFDRPYGSGSLERGYIGAPGDYAPPIRVTSDGARVLVGTGDVVDAQSRLLTGNVFGASGVSTFQDGHWLENGGLVTIRAVGSDALVERRDADFAVVEQQTFPGSPLALLPVGDAFFVVTGADRPRFARYQRQGDAGADAGP